VILIEEDDMRWTIPILAALVALPVSKVNAAEGGQERIDQLDQQVHDLSDQVNELKRSQSAQYSDIQNLRSQDVQTAIKNGRPTWTSADGQFSIALRSLVQLDSAYYSQGKAPSGTDFSTGTNFRRARLGLSGTLFKDWSYEFLYDLGGSGTEGSTISSAYLQYDGLAPLHFRIGAYPVPESFDDSTSASDLAFLERAQPTDVARNIAGADGRNAATAFAYDDDYFAALSLTAGKVDDSAVFDEQQALVGKLAYRLYKDADANFVLGGDTTWLFNTPDSTAGANSVENVVLRERPELNVDSQSTYLVTTGNIDAKTLLEWGVEAAGNYQNLYAQTGYFGYDVSRRTGTLPDPSFNGWYAQASWVLTGEAKPYKPERGAYGSPTPANPVSSEKLGLGAWEIASRYSVLDLNYNQGVAGKVTPTGGIRGGEQKIWTVGLNWYPNTAIRFQLDFQHTDVSRLNGTGGDIGAKVDAVSLRTQFAL
jgi:phosphate-selective porin OprO/OprP